MKTQKTIINISQYPVIEVKLPTDALVKRVEVDKAKVRLVYENYLINNQDFENRYYLALKGGDQIPIQKFEYVTTFKHNNYSYLLVQWIPDEYTSKPTGHQQIDMLEVILNFIERHNYAGVTVEDIKGKRRPRIISDLRHVFCYLARKYTKNSLIVIGNHINRNHASVMHAVVNCQQIPQILKRAEYIEKLMISNNVISKINDN